ncbi:hypothetical protein [Stygiolobus caldivivus]|uniref:Uncharacterized protein n=1 Tax=Stygiolobus caldivivus TaxID=2824673 RepID=A0A8D5ZHZ8_9CREN|nr:hypothetical protein [Stygiolobus caldivivus]BCU68852.1 hypothetical protein KN1_01490 [Stygiolobus caldivivus]
MESKKREEKESFTPSEDIETQQKKKLAIDKKAGVSSELRHISQPTDNLTFNPLLVLQFPLPPKVTSVGELDTQFKLTERKPEVIKLSFPQKPVVSMSSLDTSFSLLEEPIQVQKLHFSPSPTVMMSQLDTSFEVKEEEKVVLPKLVFPPRVSVSIPSLDVSLKLTSNYEKYGKEFLDVDFLDNFLSFTSSFIDKDRGKILIIYDENKHGIEDSIKYIATEVALIHGHERDPITVSRVNDLSKLTLKNVGTTSGIFVLKRDKERDLCELIKSKDEVCKDNYECKSIKETEEILIDSLNGISGYNYSIIIMPKCLYDILSPKLVYKPDRIVEDNLTKEEVSTLAYLASGYQLNWKGYDALDRTKQKFEELLSSAWRWLRRNYIDLDIPNQGNESPYHRELKAFVIKHLIENEKVDESDILVESDVCGGLKPDIYVSSRRLAIDVKTSIGYLPSDEVLEVKKYASCAERIWVVMRPIAALLDLEGVIGRIKCAHKQGINIDVMIPVKDRLVTLEEFINGGRKYMEDLSANKHSTQKT